MVVRDLPVVLEVTCCTRPPQNTHDEREKEREKKNIFAEFQPNKPSPMQPNQNKNRG